MRVLYAFTLFFVFWVAGLSSASSQSADPPSSPLPLTILRITPDGENAPDSRQIVIEFNRPVVPLGRMDRTDEETGISITPPLSCAWRWLNASSLACNLDGSKSLQPATRYELIVGNIITAQDGGRLSTPYQHSFTTIRPNVEWSDFRRWTGPETPQIRLVFNQAVSIRSVEDHVFLTPVSEEEVRLPVIVHADEQDQDAPAWIPIPGEKSWISFEHVFSRRSDDRKTSIGGEEARRVWLVSPAKPLKSDSSYALHVEPGVVSALGDQKGDSARVLVTFDTFPDFRFSGLQCTTTTGKPLLLTAPDSSGDASALCDPMMPVSLAFSSPVLLSELKKNIHLVSGTKQMDGKDLWNDEGRDWTALAQPHQKGRLYSLFLPPGLKAAQTYRLEISGPEKGFSTWFQALSGGPEGSGIEDEFGRHLPDKAHISFATDHRRPNFEIIHHASVLEKETDSETPLYVNNLNTVTLNYRRVRSLDAQDNLSVLKKIPSVQDIQFAIPFGFRELLGGQSGALYGMIDTSPSVTDSPYARRFFAQVTPWQVHSKLGHFRSLTWVSDLQTGAPVVGATIQIYKGSFSSLSLPSDILATAVTDENGLAFLPGTQTLDPQGTLIDTWEDTDTRLFLRAQKNEDMALLPLSSEFGIDLWSVSDGTVSSDTRPQHHHIRSWGMSAQGIYRAGDTIQYKIYVRGQDNLALTPPPALRYTLSIRDPAGNIVSTVPDIALSPFGAYASEFPVPKTAPVGWYDFLLIADSSRDGKEADRIKQGNNTVGGNAEEEEGASPFLYTLYPLRVLVSDFTPAPFHVTTEVNGSHFRPDDSLAVSVAATLHSGGPWPDAAARLTVTLTPRVFEPQTPLAKGFVFDSASPATSSTQIFQEDVTLDDAGRWNENVPLPQQDIVYGTLSIEGAVQDDRGKSIAGTAQADYTGVNRMVGLRSPQWIYETGKETALETLVVDDSGTPAPDVPVNAIFEKETVSVAKVKGAGNAYLSETSVEWKEVASCNLKSLATAPVSCSFTPKTSGTYRLTASIADTKGRFHRSVASFWVTGNDYVQWNDQNETALSIIPEKSTYTVGETARYLVKNPWPGARALVTIERYGVLDSFTKTLEGGAPVIEFPIKPDYLPGFFLSVTLFSPRVEAPPLESGQVDLGKPAFRMGYTKVPVLDPYKQITVSAKTDKDVYRPGDAVHITLQATPLHAPEPRQPVELAVAVLDDSVFDLIASGRTAFDPYAGFNGLDGLDLRNYSLLTRLVGRQKFEKKGANPGGDGGTDLDIRNIFKFVSYWNPSVPTDEEGRAQIEFKVPDNLTGWRVLALAVTPGDRMGLGEATFKVNRPTELRPVMPNQIREGDRFEAGFSVMNRTDQTRTLRVDISASGDLKNKAPVSVSKTLTLAPYKRETIFLPLETGFLPIDRNSPEGLISFTATAADDIDSDGLTHGLPVLKSRIFDVGALYGTTTDPTIQEALAFPAGVYTDAGDLSVTLSPSIIGNLEGSFRYLRDYPYFCWEQLLTKAVMAARYQSLRPWLDPDLSWPNSNALPDQILARASEFQAPGGGMAYFVPDDAHADPYLSAYTALAFAWLRRDGYSVPEPVERRLTEYLKNFLRHDAAPDFYQSGMTSTVRAVALDALSFGENSLSQEDVERYRPHMPRMDLFGKAHFMMAALRAGKEPQIVHQTADAILASGNETAGKISFNQTYDDGYARILSSPLRDNCAILSALVLYAGTPEGKDLVGDKPLRLVRFITQSRGSRDHWENTQENIFCLNAITDYARMNEAQAPDLNVTASVDGHAFGQATFSSFTDKPVVLTRPIGPEDPGRSASLKLEKEGQGRLYYAARLRTAPLKPNADAVNAGMDLHREYSIQKGKDWILLDDPSGLARGQTVRVDLYLSVPSARNFVVIDDPVPSGLEPVNRDLATASEVDSDQALFPTAGGSFWFKYNDWKEYNFSFWSFYHQELRHDSVRFYADYLPPGNYHLSYMAQAIAEGTFTVLPARAEEMYDSDIYAQSTGRLLSIGHEEKPEQPATPASGDASHAPMEK